MKLLRGKRNRRSIKRITRPKSTVVERNEFINSQKKMIINSRLNAAGDRFGCFFLFSPTVRVDDQNKTENSEKSFEAQKRRKNQQSHGARWKQWEKRAQVSVRMVPQSEFSSFFMEIFTFIAQLQLWLSRPLSWDDALVH